jgi:hypothetical protein
LVLRLQSTPRVGGGSALVVRPIRAMKKSSTWYSVALAVFNVGLALGVLEATDVWTGAYRQLGLKLPKITEIALSFYWWPYLFVGFAILLALVSVSSRLPSSLFYHFFIMLLVLECFILLMEQFIFALPVASVMTLR